MKAKPPPGTPGWREGTKLLRFFFPTGQGLDAPKIWPCGTPGQLGACWKKNTGGLGSRIGGPDHFTKGRMAV